MDEDFYHSYVSQTHANHLKELLIKNRIVSYHMVGSFTIHIQLPPDLECKLIPQSNTTPLREGPC